MNTLWQVPVVVASLLTWLATPPLSLADAAEREVVRRQLMGKATRVYTNIDLPAATFDSAARVVEPPPGVASGAASDAAALAAPAPEVRDEAWWRGRVGGLRSSIDRNEILLKAMQTRINSLTADIVSRDDPFQRQELRDQLQKSLNEFDRLQTAIVQARRAIETLQDEARRSGTPPGWLR